MIILYFGFFGFSPNISHYCKTLKRGLQTLSRRQTLLLPFVCVFVCFCLSNISRLDDGKLHLSVSVNLNLCQITCDSWIDFLFSLTRIVCFSCSSWRRKQNNNNHYFFYITRWTEGLLNKTQSERLPQAELWGPPAEIECSVLCNSSAGCPSVDGQLDQAALWSCYSESRLGLAALRARRALSPPTFLHTEVQEGQLPERNLGSWQLHWSAALVQNCFEPKTLLQRRPLEFKSS